MYSLFEFRVYHVVSMGCYYPSSEIWNPMESIRSLVDYYSTPFLQMWKFLYCHPPKVVLSTQAHPIRNKETRLILLVKGDDMHMNDYKHYSHSSFSYSASVPRFLPTHHRNQGGKKDLSQDFVSYHGV
jgi:hypothetical protein